MKGSKLFQWLTVLMLGAMACAPRMQPIEFPSYPESESDAGIHSSRRTPEFEYRERGIASFMADEVHGKRTASGEIFNMRELVAAHKKLPFGTLVKVTNLKNGKSVIVRIIDRGPYVKDRIIDLSFAAAKKLDFVEEGTTEVEIKVVKMAR